MTNDEEELIGVINKLHRDCHRIVFESMGKYLSIAGNVGIFCQSESDFKRFEFVRRRITQTSNNSNQKYFRLKHEIIVSPSGNTPGASYIYLYIRKPAEDTPEAGDIDFLMSQEEFTRLKQQVSEGLVEGASIYERPGWDMVELKNTNISAIAYISTLQMAEKVRVRF